MQKSSIPNETILKIYLGSSVDDPTLAGYNWTEMELMDRQLTDQNVRFSVYEWVSMTKDCSRFFSILTIRNLK